MYLDKSDIDKSDFRLVGNIVVNGYIFGGFVSYKSESEFRYAGHFPSGIRVDVYIGGHALHLLAGSGITRGKLRKITQKNSALGIVGRVPSIIIRKNRVL